MPSLVSHEHKLVFVHVQRTAGTSIVYTLADILAPDGFEKLEGYPNHLSFADLLEIHGNRLWGYLKFMVVRNPWDLTASSVMWHRKHGNDILTIDRLARKTSTPRALGLLQMDYVLRFEHLREDFGVLCDRIGIERRELQRLNAGLACDYRELHSAESVETVRKRFWATIEGFGYEF